jgi:hypothetical protein
MADINKIGEQAQALLKEVKTESTKVAALVEERNKQLKPLLEKVWAALEKKQVVNGCATKDAWATTVGFTKRAINNIVHGRKSRAGNPGSRPKPLELLKKLLTFISEQPRSKNDPDSLVNIRCEALEMCDEQLDWHPPVWKKELEELRADNKAADDQQAAMAQYFADKNKPKPPKVIVTVKDPCADYTVDEGEATTNK